MALVCGGGRGSFPPSPSLDLHCPFPPCQGQTTIHEATGESCCRHGGDGGDAHLHGFFVLPLTGSEKENWKEMEQKRQWGREENGGLECLRHSSPQLSLPPLFSVHSPFILNPERWKRSDHGVASGRCQEGYDQTCPVSIPSLAAIFRAFHLESEACVIGSSDPECLLWATKAQCRFGKAMHQRSVPLVIAEQPDHSRALQAGRGGDRSRLFGRWPSPCNPCTEVPICASPIVGIQRLPSQPLGSSLGKPQANHSCSETGV